MWKRKKEREKKEKEEERNAVCVWRIKKEGKKKEKKKRRREEILSVRLLLVNIDEKKIIFLEREKNHFNCTFK